MKHVALLATVVVGLAVGIAACSDTSTQPAAALENQEAESAALLWPTLPTEEQVTLACRFFAERIGWRYRLTQEERDMIAAACERIAARLIPLVPLDLREVCDAIMQDEAFTSLPQRIQDSVRAFCSRVRPGTR
jgi:hypothetical protein